MLELGDCQVKIVASNRAAVNAITQRTRRDYALVLVHSHMPTKSGIEATLAIRRAT